MRSILLYLLEMVPPALLGGLMWQLLLPVRRLRRGRKGILPGDLRDRAALILWMYLAGLLVLTLTPAGFWHELAEGQFPDPPRLSLDRINLIPLRVTWKQYSYYFRRELWAVLIVNFLGNLLMFLPVGFFAGLLSDRPRWWKALLLSGGLSLVIELLQLFVDRGTDVDDLILNALGGLLGHGVFLLFRRASPQVVERCAGNQGKESAEHGR